MTAATAHRVTNTFCMQVYYLTLPDNPNENTDYGLLMAYADTRLNLEYIDVMRPPYNLGTAKHGPEYGILQDDKMPKGIYAVAVHVYLDSGIGMPAITLANHSCSVCVLLAVEEHSLLYNSYFYWPRPDCVGVIVDNHPDVPWKVIETSDRKGFDEKVLPKARNVWSSFFTGKDTKCVRIHRAWLVRPQSRATTEQ